MELKELSNLYEEYKGLSREINRKKTSMAIDSVFLEKQIDDLQREADRLRDLSKSLDIEDPLLVKASNLGGAIREEIEQINKYGVFNVRDMGEALASLASKIIGVPIIYATKKGKIEQTTPFLIPGYVYYNVELATLARSTKYRFPLIDLNFAFAEAGTPTLEDELTNRIQLYAGWERAQVEMTKLEEKQQLTVYDISSGLFKVRPVEESEPVDFISEFLSFVSMYKYEKKLQSLSKQELEALVLVFIETYGDRYTKYKEEQALLVKRTKEEQRQKLRDEVAAINRQKEAEKQAKAAERANKNQGNNEGRPSTVFATRKLKIRNVPGLY